VPYQDEIVSTTYVEKVWCFCHLCMSTLVIDIIRYVIISIWCISSSFRRVLHLARQQILFQLTLGKFCIKGDKASSSFRMEGFHSILSVKQQLQRQHNHCHHKRFYRINSCLVPTSPTSAYRLNIHTQKLTGEDLQNPQMESRYDNHVGCFKTLVLVNTKGKYKHYRW